MQNTLISIIIPTYNRAHLIKDTLDSILEQTYPNWECLVIDDGSTDDTEDLMKVYCKQDSRFKYHKRPNDRPKGANACRNYGFELCKGNYINWFDDDDIMLPNKLKQQIKLLDENNSASYCICQTRCVEKKSQRDLGLRSPKISSENRFEDYICYKIFWLTTAPLWRRGFLEAHHLRFDEGLQQSQEYDFHIKALAIDPDYLVLEEPLVEMYQHEGNLSNNWLEDDAKVISNVQVKFRTLKSYSDRLSLPTQMKLLEMLTITYKDLLTLKRYDMAKLLQNTLISSLNYIPFTRFKRFHFYFRIHLIYLSYRIFGRGYSLLKPVT